MQTPEKGKILILRLYDKILSVLICRNHILSIQADDADSDSAIGNIYVGRVQNISHNIGAAFVEIQKGLLTFLPLTEAKSACITNRKPDGILKIGDELLVQLVKEPVKTKLAGVSARLSLAGSYTVIAPGSGIKISSKLGKKYDHLYKNLVPLQDIAAHFTLTIRTNAASLEEPDAVIAEAQALAARMERLLSTGDKRTCFSCLYQSDPAWLSFIRNCYQSEYDEIITDEKDIYETLLHEGYKPSNENKTAAMVRFYEDDRLPLYKLYSIETRIRELLAKKVWLKSGAYLVIEQTEALVAIDVNTGKYESRKNPEETYLKINLEAAEAIAEALRARNLSGMILIDFINMKKQEHVRQLMEYMKTLLKKDAVPAYVVDITGLGLMEITRQKKNKPFAEQMRSLRKGYADP
ncbi:MAG: ribonuclease E/G [Roseburia sp.]|nr:ribonuclease E/G [Roseburia sp.]